MHIKTLPLLSLFLLSFPCFSQSYFGPGGIVHDDGRNNIYTRSINDLPSSALSAGFGLKEVCINITHTWMADLDVRLTAPDGTTIMLAATLGGDQDGYLNTCFSMDTSVHIIDGGFPYTAKYRPFSPIGTVNNGSDGNGTWTLHVLDTYAYADGGEVLDWSITFGPDAPSPMNFESSHLPIVILNTTDQLTIPDDPKIHGRIRIIHNDLGLDNYLTDTPIHDSDLGIEVRGSSSQQFPKKSFGFETWDEEGDDLETELLGLPKEEDWILYAPYTDKSFLRDALTYKLGRDMGHYAPRTVFCELFLNGDYHGVYCLEEKIKRDKNRVNIAKIEEQDTTGDKLTGGYLLKVDRDDGEGSFFVSEYEGTFADQEIRVVFEDPEGPDLHPKQKAYIENYYDRFERALYGKDFADPQVGYRAYIDVESFIDLFIVSEIGHNVDAYRLSTFLFKDRNSIDSLLHAGPLWDFNLAYGNVDYCNCQATEGWAYINSGACGNTPLWWARLLEDPAYADQLRCRYDSLRRNVLSTEVLTAWIDSMYDTLAPTQSRNYERWPILSRYVWPNFFIGNTYAEEVGYFSDWLSLRLRWMDENLPGKTCLASGTHDLIAGELEIYPNPASDYVEIQTEEAGILRIVAIQGVEVISQEFDPGSPRVNIRGLSSGVYMVSLETANAGTFRGKIVKYK